MVKVFAGLDVSDKTTCICVLSQEGHIVHESKVATDPEEIARALRPYRRRLTRVGQETGTKAAWLHKELVRHRLPMVCLDAFYAKNALSARRNKTDRTDAHGIALLLARGLFTTAYVKSDACARLRLLLGVRNLVLYKALQLQTALRMNMKSFGLRAATHRRRVAGRQQRLDDQTQYLFSVLARASAALNAEVAPLDKIIVQTARKDAICRRLMTVPGVGPITALTFRAAVDDPSRFSCSRDVAAHFGLTPKRFQSGESDFSGNISRRGACALRMWAKDLAARKRFKVAAVACARKLAVILHRLWASGEDFDPRRA